MSTLPARSAASTSPPAATSASPAASTSASAKPSCTSPQPAPRSGRSSAPTPAAPSNPSSSVSTRPPAPCSTSRCPATSRSPTSPSAPRRRARERRCRRQSSCARRGRPVHERREELHQVRVTEVLGPAERGRREPPVLDRRVRAEREQHLDELAVPLPHDTVERGLPLLFDGHVATPERVDVEPQLHREADRVRVSVRGRGHDERRPPLPCVLVETGGRVA